MPFFKNTSTKNRTAKKPNSPPRQHIHPPNSLEEAPLRKPSPNTNTPSLISTSKFSKFDIHALKGPTISSTIEQSYKATRKERHRDPRCASTPTELGFFACTGNGSVSSPALTTTNAKRAGFPVVTCRTCLAGAMIAVRDGRERRGRDVVEIIGRSRTSDTSFLGYEL